MNGTLQALLDADLTAQAQALAGGAVSSVQLTEALIDRIALRQGALNAYLHLDAAGALRAAAASDARRAEGRALGPLDGLGLAVKDNIDVAGMPTTAGMAVRRARVAAQDAFVVGELRRQGMVLLGKLNMHEAALGATNDNPHFGRCEHPLRPGFTPGGSSGGSACAVAAGLCALALGTDTMGSVRLPAAYCGVVGFKAGHGIVSTRGSVACCFALDHVGPLVRSVRDLALVMPALAVYDPECADARPARPRSAVAAPRWVVAEDVAALGATPQVAAAYDAAVRALRARGDAVAALSLGGYDFGRARRAGLLMTEADLLVVHAPDWQQQPQQFSPALARMLRWAEQQSAAALAAAQRVAAAAHVEAARWFRHGDVMLLPTALQTAFAFDAPVPANQADLTAIANLAGLPALSLPLPVAPDALPDALPVGLQAIAPAGAEATLLQLPLQGVAA